MLSYQQLKHHPRALRAFTGLDQAEFEKLLTHFEMAYHAYRYDQHVIKKSRKRRYGGGRKPHLTAMEDKLLFILFYFKVYPLQEVMAFLFETSQGRVNEWIHTLSIVLHMALGEAQALPVRDPKNLEQTLALCLSVDFIIDGTERRIQRPHDATEQQEKYSGKKKAHTVKNNLIIDVEDMVHSVDNLLGGRRLRNIGRDASATIGPTRKRILVVDDDPNVREVAVSSLESLGYQMLAAENGPAALDLLARSGPVDLLLVDMAMPGSPRSKGARPASI